jgi:tripartite-type tricarboxylate transporter receptor subunit TctC
MRAKPKARFLAVVAAGILLGGAHQVLAQQSFPTKPIRMLVPTSAGGGTDFVARIVSQQMADTWKQPVVVENRGGAGGIIATDFLAKAAPDGHTLMTMSNNHVVNASLYDKLPYDTLKDFAGVTLVADIPAVLVAAPVLGVNSVQELINLAKSKPGQLNFGSPGSGTGGHLNAEQFKLAAGINVIHVPFKGTPEVLSGVVGGSIHYCIAPVTAVLPLAKAGRLVALAVTTRERTPLMSDLPTLAESGLPGYDFNLWVGLLAPARTPVPLKNKIANEVARIVALQEVKDRLLTQGATPHTTSPAEFDAYMKAELDHYAPLVKASGAKAY